MRLFDERGIHTREEHGDRIGDGAQALPAWAAFQAMAAERVDEPFAIDGEQVHVHYDDDDLLLFESFTGSEGFSLSFTRQFGFHTAELEYFGMNAIRLQIDFPVTDDLRELPEAQLWGRPNALDNWVEQVEAAPAFSAFSTSAPSRFYATQSDI